MSYYYDRQGNPTDAEGFESVFRTEDGNRVAKDKIGDVEVSTVFLGVDHSFGSGRPLLFETMVFGGELDEEQVRYSTEAEALAGHSAMVAQVKATQR
jgi:hypothetical protein